MFASIPPKWGHFAFEEHQQPPSTTEGAFLCRLLFEAKQGFPTKYLMRLPRSVWVFLKKKEKLRRKTENDYM